MISAQQIRELREKTGAGVSDVKKALEDSGGDAEKATALLESKLGSSAIKKAGRETGAGLVDAYIHSNGRIASLVEIYCETDFVARNPGFKEFAHDIAMQVAAMSPTYVARDDVPDDVIRTERARAEDEAKKLGKPAAVLQNIADGKLNTYLGSVTLLEQQFVKDQNKTVQNILNEAIGRFGENIRIGKFIRFEL